MEQRPMRNAFGDLLVDPDTLTQRERIDVVRRLAGRWQAAADRETAWFGRKVALWLSGPADGDLLRTLGLRPPAGSTLSAPALAARQRRDDALLQLSVAAGGDRRALRLFEAGADPGPCAELVALLQHDPPGSAAAFTRARQRVSNRKP